MKEPDNGLKGKIAVITGGGGIICSSMARTLAEIGVKVAVLDLNHEAVENVAKEIIDNGGEAIAIQANVLQKDSLEKAKKHINEALGSCDILINGAGGNHPKSTTSREYFAKEDLNNDDIKTFFDIDPADVSFVFDLNFLGTFLPSQVFARDMIGKERGIIINISSMNAFTPLTKIPAYSAAKSAVSNFTQWLAVHFSKENIRVNAIAPGFFLTEQNRALLTDEQGNLTTRGQTIIDHTPLGKFGAPEDLSGTLLWLCGEGSDFVTGVVVPVDGGFSAFSGV